MYVVGDGVGLGSRPPGIQRHVTGIGASVDWAADQRKVIITMKNKTIELWIGQGVAKVNGTAAPIDPNNPDVKPVLAPPGRTMLPLRFIVENLGCKVDWNQNNRQMVTITYPAS